MTMTIHVNKQLNHFLTYLGTFIIFHSGFEDIKQTYVVCTGRLDEG